MLDSSILWKERNWQERAEPDRQERCTSTFGAGVAPSAFSPFLTMSAGEERTSPAPFRLSALLAGHSDDVRGLASDPSSRLLSGSRDGTARTWTRPGDQKGRTGGWVEESVSRDHQGFVNSVTWSRGAPGAPQGECLFQAVGLFVKTNSRPGLEAWELTWSRRRLPSYGRTRRAHLRTRLPQTRLSTLSGTSPDAYRTRWEYMLAPRFE